jgi:hypothetical protein
MDNSICLDEILLHWTGSSHMFMDNSVMYRSKINGGECCERPFNCQSSSSSVESFGQASLISQTIRNARIDDLLLEESSFSMDEGLPDPLACSNRMGCQSRWGNERVAPTAHFSTAFDVSTSPSTLSSVLSSPSSCCSTGSREAPAAKDACQKTPQNASW